MRYNRLFSDDLSYAVPWSDKELKIEYATFRDKLQPGQEEEWRIKISGTKGEKVAAEMVAAMYDASLDAFAVNSWYFNPFPGFSKWQTWTGGDFGVQSGQLVQQAWNEYFEDQYLRYTTLNWFGWEMHDFGRMYFRNKAMAMDGVMLNSAPPSPESAGKPNMADAESAESEEVDLQTKKEDTIEKKAEEKAPPVRTNLKETVFFFPNLMTDERGNILIKFKMNEALTRWKFLGFAHTKSLQYALTEKSVITQKELMVQPNPPRFFRESDEIEFTAKVSNLTSGQLTGTARLQLFDALTNEPVDALLENTNPEIPFSAKAGQSARLAWK
ncbi:MAG TPA: alpha-2-macroglobulin family protein, partial [Saprospiraceae bacterium]|nr:alpha-2-macroglobulin family protein [Saprospiraceae bacterium]